MLLFIVFQLTLMFIENLYTYQIMRFLQVASSVGAFGPMVTYVYEICGKKYRSGRFSMRFLRSNMLNSMIHAAWIIQTDDTEWFILYDWYKQGMTPGWGIVETLKAINCIVVGIPWSVGYSVTALIAQLTRDWFHMLIVIVCITAPWPLG